LIIFSFLLSNFFKYTPLPIENQQSNGFYNSEFGDADVSGTA